MCLPLDEGRTSNLAESCPIAQQVDRATGLEPASRPYLSIAVIIDGPGLWFAWGWLPPKDRPRKTALPTRSTRPRQGFGGRGVCGKLAAVQDGRSQMTRSKPPMCSATGCPVAEWLAHPLTDHRKFDILQSGPVAGLKAHFSW
jgi:hypothetical protein